MTTPIQNINSTAELEAINDILACIGEAAVTNIIAVDENADVANALRCLRTVNQTIQAKGWTWNIQDNFILQPDLYTKQIPYVDNYLVVQATGGATPTVYRNRGGFVYDSSNQTDQFDNNLTVRIILKQPFDEMPTCFRDLIVTKASRMFNAKFFGDANVDAYLAQQEREAYIQSMEYEMDYSASNMLSGDNFTSGQLAR